MSVLEKCKIETYANGLQVGVEALTDKNLAAAARNYKKNVAARYRLIKSEDISFLAEKEVHASVKLDGQLHFLYKNGSDCFLFNPKGRVLMGLSLLEEAQKALAGMDDVLLAGELYYADANNRSRVYEVTSALGSNGGKKPHRLRFGVFDLLRSNGVNFVRKSYSELLSWLQEHVPAEGMFHRVASRTVDKNELTKMYHRQVLDQGQEGIVCHPEEGPRIYKIKPCHNVDAVIIGFTERPDEPGTLRVLLTALMRPDGSFQTFARVGTGFDEIQRRQLFRQLKPLEVPSAYKEADRNHTLFTMIKPTQIAELTFHDILTESATGKAQIRAVVEYNEDGWQARIPERFVNVLFPVFVRLRDDKDVNPTDLRLTQISELVDLDNLEAPGRPLKYTESEILRREVWVKVVKESTSIRKFIYWKTNKEDEDPNYPPFVFCYVDYSPNRASPMKRSVRTAQSAEEAELFFEMYRTKEIKRGWKQAC